MQEGNSSNTAAAVAPVAAATAAAPPPSTESKTLWMGAIQQSWDENFVMSLFPPTAELAHVKVMRNPANMPAGYAFLDFYSHEAAKNVLNTYNGLPIPGTSVYFRLNWGAGAGKNRVSLNPTSSTTPSTVVNQEYSLFVGDLAPEVTDDVLLRAFTSRYTACSNAKVVTDATTGSSKGYGFVRFTDKGQSDEALRDMNGVLVGSRPIRVSAATARRHDRNNILMHGGMIPGQYSQVPSPMDNRMNGGGGGYRGNNSWGGGGGMGRSVSESESSFQGITNQEEVVTGQEYALSSDGSGYQQTSAPATENTTVFVGNLDPAVTEEQLEQHFHSFGNIVQIKIPPNRGCGFVKFETREAAEKALATMHGSTLCGLRIRLDWGKANAGRHQGGGGHESIMGYSLQQAQQQFYMQQWQQQQVQAAAYYYRYPQAAQMYMIPQPQIPQNYRPSQTGAPTTGGSLFQSPQIMPQQLSPQQQHQMNAGLLSGNMEGEGTQEDYLGQQAPSTWNESG